MRSEPRWLPVEEVIEVNRDAVAATGEPFLLRDQALLESACARPRNYWAYGEDDVLRLSLIFLFGLARNHAFEQGNKRTAFTAAVMFLESNGYGLVAPDGEELAERIIDVIEGKMSENDFQTYIRPFVRRTS